jgi:hypothetical protein
VLQSNRFRSDEDVKAAVVQWFWHQTRDLFVEEIHWLMHQWYACLNGMRDPLKLLLMASTPSPRTLSKWVSFE